MFRVVSKTERHCFFHSYKSGSLFTNGTSVTALEQLARSARATRFWPVTVEALEQLALVSSDIKVKFESCLTIGVPVGEVIGVAPRSLRKQAVSETWAFFLRGRPLQVFLRGRPLPVFLRGRPLPVFLRGRPLPVFLRGRPLSVF